MRRSRSPRWLHVALLVLFIILVDTSLRVVPASNAQTSGPTRTAAPTAIPTPPIAERPDSCEPNNARAQACAIAIDSVNGPFTFLPAGDQDYYRVDLGAPDGLQTMITVRASGMLDLMTTITRDDGAALATISSPAISTTLAADVGGGVIVRVENRAASDPSGHTYNIDIRRTLPPPPPPPTTTANLPPDKLENNWNPITAAPIGVGAIYDLNFVCPVSWGCVGGDHDYLRLPVKRGGQYLICTFDLGPGVDTEIDLFWGTSDTPIAGNDDARPNASFLSVIRWVAPADGEVIIRIAPRTGGTNPVVFAETASSYRFAVALSGSALAKQLEARIADQTHVPAPTPGASEPASGGNRAGGGMPAPAPSPPLAGGASPAAAPAPASANPSGMTARGQAIVTADETAFRIGPHPNASLIQMLPAEIVITLAGQYNGLWVSVTTADSVLPGWILGTDLRRVTPAQPPAASGTEEGNRAESPSAMPVTPHASGASTPTPVPTLALVVRPIAPLPPEPPPAPAPRAALTVSVTVIAATALPNAARLGGAPTATPGLLTPRVGIRVQLVNAFGDLLAEAVTGPSGQVVLTHEQAASRALFIRLPAAGLQLPVDSGQPAITIALPIGDRP